MANCKAGILTDTGFQISLLAIAPGSIFLWAAAAPPDPRVAVGGAPPPPTPLLGLRPPWALDPILDGALGPMAPGPRLDLELPGPNMGLGGIEKQKGARLGPRWAHLD